MNMMLARTSRQEKFTTGVLFINGNIVCHTLEPHCMTRLHEKKVMGKTAIPEGEYKVSKYPSAHFRRMMPLLEKVPQFRGVLIHPGNSVKDTKGCILVGQRNTPSTLRNSRATFNRLWEMMERAWSNHECVYITVC